MFYFADEYIVHTSRDGSYARARVRRSSGNTPFDLTIIDEGPTTEHGTCISAAAVRLALSPETVRELIGARFVADPNFSILVNGTQVALTDIEHLCEKFVVSVGSHGTLTVRRFDSERSGRTSKQHGVAWWVSGRLVGTPSWEGLGGPYVDARTATAKRYTYIIEANMLHERVKADWSGFHANSAVLEAQRAADEFIRDDLRVVMADVRRERKRAALEGNKASLRELPPLSQDHVAKFVDELQLRCPTFGERELSSTVEVLSSLERARTGYTLLNKLASLKPDDLDGLNSILSEWTVSDAKKVLSELRYRLELIRQLEEILRRGHADELHELQPLFERGLWIFGPEFESISFESNRALSTVVKEFFGAAALTLPSARADFVVRQESSVGVYSCDAFDASHEVSGYSRVVVVELKRGGSQISLDNKDQAMKYVRQLRRAVGRLTPIIAYVLGEEIEPEADVPTREGEGEVIPRRYDVVLRQANARTFHLLRKIEFSRKELPRDPELTEVLGSTLDLFAPSRLAEDQCKINSVPA